MAKHTTSFTVDGSQNICTAHKPRELNTYMATISIFGTFGGGTVTLLQSPDGGTTKIPLKDFSGSAYSTTTNDCINIELGVASKNGTSILLYATLTGSTAPSLTVTVHDNTGG